MSRRKLGHHIRGHAECLPLTPTTSFCIGVDVARDACNASSCPYFRMAPFKICAFLLNHICYRNCIFPIPILKRYNLFKQWDTAAADFAGGQKITNIWTRYCLVLLVFLASFSCWSGKIASSDAVYSIESMYIVLLMFDLHSYRSHRTSDRGAR